MPRDTRSERPRILDAIRAGALDRTDLVVVGAAVVVVASITGASLLAASQRTETVSAVSHVMPAPTSASPTPTVTARPIVDLLVPSSVEASTFADRLRSGRIVRSTVGAGYTASTDGYRSLAAKLDRGASIVVVVPSSTDASAGVLSLQSSASETVGAIRKAAPAARVLIVGPVVSATAGSGLSAVRSALKGVAASAKVAYVDPTDQGWVGRQVDTTGAVTLDGLKSVAKGLGSEVASVLRG